MTQEPRQGSSHRSNVPFRLTFPGLPGVLPLGRAACVRTPRGFFFGLWLLQPCWGSRGTRFCLWAGVQPFLLLPSSWGGRRCCGGWPYPGQTPGRTGPHTRGSWTWPYTPSPFTPTGRAWPKVPSCLLMCLLKEAPSASASCWVSGAGCPGQYKACLGDLAEGKEMLIPGGMGALFCVCLRASVH